MNTFKAKLMQFIKEEEGLTTVEYAVAGSLVAATVVVAFTNLGDAVEQAITGLCNAIATSPAVTVTC